MVTDNWSTLQYKYKYSALSLWMYGEGEGMRYGFYVIIIIILDFQVADILTQIYEHTSFVLLYWFLYYRSVHYVMKISSFCLQSRNEYHHPFAFTAEINVPLGSHCYCCFRPLVSMTLEVNVVSFFMWYTFFIRENLIRYFNHTKTINLMFGQGNVPNRSLYQEHEEYFIKHVFG